jgi:hypothetical protein
LPAAGAVIVQVSVAALPDATRAGVVDVHAVTPAEPLTVKTTVPVGAAPLGAVTVAVKTMLPPIAVTPLLVTTLLVSAVVAPATLATPKVRPDAIRTLSARYRTTDRRTPVRRYFSLLIFGLLGKLLGGYYYVFFSL